MRFENPKKILALFILFFLINCVYVSAFQTYTEKFNPFNKFLDPSEGVDLFSGTVAYTKNLYEMNGRNGLDIEVELNYSSNVYLVARARNDVSPTSWVGLGWYLSYGSIVREHNGTVTPIDDNFYWYSPDGYKKRILIQFPLDAQTNIPTGQPACNIEEHPYIKVQCNYDVATKQILGWTLYKPDGSKLLYGDFQITDTRNANRYTFAVGEYVEPSINKVAPDLFPYQWDLSSIEDHFANKISFEYDQVQEKIQSYTWDAPVIPANQWETTRYFTKASYLWKITNPEGGTIVFKKEDRTAKDPDEYYDQHQFFTEPDAFIEKYETDLLKTIEIKNPKGTLIKKFELEYTKLNREMKTLYNKDYYLKSLLSKITEYNGDGEIFNVDEFTYFDNFSLADDQHRGTIYKDNYNYGALRKQRNKLGFVSEYDYEKKTLTIPKTTIDDIVMPGSFCTPPVAMGMKSSGYPFGVATSDKECKTYNWDGSKWNKEEVNVPTEIQSGPVGLDVDTFMRVTAGDDYIALLGGHHVTIPNAPDIPAGHKLCFYNWNEESEHWELYPTLFDLPYFGYDFHLADFRVWRLIGGKDYIVLSSNRDKVMIFNKFNQNGVIEWKKTLDIDVGNPLFDPKNRYSLYNIPVYLNQNNILIHGKDGNGIYKMLTYQWNGYSWNKTFDSSEPGNDFSTLLGGPKKESIFSIEKDFFVASQRFLRIQKPTQPKVPPNYPYLIYNWDGESWKKTYKDISSISCNYSTPGEMEIPSSYSNVGVPFNDVTNDNFKYSVLTWQGYAWEKTIDNVGFVGYKKTILNDDYCVVVQEVKKNVGTNNEFYEQRYNWDNKNHNWYLTSPHKRTPSSWEVKKWGTPASFFDTRCFLSQYDFFVTSIISGDPIACIDPRPVDAYIWDGKAWAEPYGSNSSGGPQWETSTGAVMTKNCIGLSHIDKISFHYKFQNKFDNDIYVYTISKKTMTPGFGSKKVIITYNYENSGDGGNNNTCNGNYDTKYGTAKFNKVKVTLANGARVESYFFNNSEADGQNLLDPMYYKKLDGLVYRSENYNNKSSSINTGSKNEYTVYKNPTWLRGSYEKRILSSTTSLDGVRTKTEKTYTLNIGSPDKNGQPRYLQVDNSGRTLTEYTLFAHEQPLYSSGMQNDNLLAQPCLEIALENYSIPEQPSQAWYNSISRNYIRSAKATTWAQSNGKWTPSAVYSWNVSAGSDGKPTADFTAFDFSPGAQNTNWQLQEVYSLYNSYGQILEVKIPGATAGSLVPSATIYRSDLAMEMAQVVNANYYECAVFTCDYDQDIPSSIGDPYLDKDNQWRKPAGVALSAGAVPTKHFGMNSLHVVNSKGPTTTIYLINSPKTYIFSAWVYPNGNTGPIKLYAVTYEGVTLTKECTGLIQNQWQYIEHRINTVATNLTISVGNLEADCDFNVDDIRFYPTDAFVTTTYYDEKWEKPVLAVDANNNPGKRIDLSSFYNTKDVSEFSGDIGFQPSDALKINLFQDEVWESEAYKDKEMSGKIEYDSHGRPEKWFKFNHQGNHTLLMKKEYYTSGLNTAGEDQCRACTFNRATDSVALCRIYATTGGISWTNKYKWLTNSPIGEWVGVTVDPGSNRVVLLDLGNNNLIGEIPAAICTLSALTSLKMDHNQLSGALPRDFGYFENMDTLSLNDNQISGEITPQLEGMIALKRLYLHNNQFTGAIPQTLGNLTLLRRLSLFGNNLTGQIPNELQHMTSCEELLLNDNDFSGVIPAGLGELINLQKLHLQNNQLTGAVPGNLGNLLNLTELYIQHNMLSDFNDPISRITTNTSVDLGYNNFCMVSFQIEDWADSIDPVWQGTQICDYRKIDSLTVSALYSRFYGDNWTNTWNMSSPINTWYGITVSSNRVTAINLHNNNLTGQISSNLGDLRQLQSLDLSNNTITGSLPVINNDGVLTSLQVQNNHLNGINESVLSWSSVPTLNIGYNALCLLPPVMESWADTHDPDWQGTQTCDYRATDSLALVDLFICAGEEDWTNTWTLDNPITTWYGITVSGGRVIQINLDNNNLIGFIPQSIGNLRQLQVLSVQLNNLYGAVPSELSYCGSLTTLQVRNNQLTDLGDGLVNLTGVSAADLGENNFCNLSAALQAWATSKDPDWNNTQVCTDYNAAGYWQFEEGSGTIANDASGNGLNGTLNNASWSGSGKVGGCLDFDGGDDYVTIPDAAALDFTAAVTLTAWVNPDNITDYHEIINKASGTAQKDNPFDFIICKSDAYGNDGDIGFSIGDGTTHTRLRSSTSISPSTWTHIAAVADGDSLYIYINGVRNVSCVQGIQMSTNSSPVVIGKWVQGAGYYPMEGFIDEVRVYNRALNASEINYLWQSAQ